LTLLDADIIRATRFTALHQSVAENSRNAIHDEVIPFWVPVLNLGTTTDDQTGF
jgi:hypothetical protein